MNEIIPSINAYLALLVVLINFVFLILVLVRTSLTTFYIIFVFICLSNMLIYFGDFMLFLTGNRNWYYLSRLGSSMIPALMFHFIIALVKSRPKRTIWIRVPYLLSGLFAMAAFLALFHPGFRWFMDKGLRNILYLILLGPFLLTGIVFVLRGIRSTSFADEKERFRYVLIAAIIGVFTGIAELLRFLIGFIPPVGHLGCLAYSSILGISIFKHRKAYDVLAQMQMKLESLAEMAARIAHEIRNPLTTIQEASASLANEIRNVDLPNIREYHDIIREEIERLNHILLNFQYFTRPLKIETEPTDIDEAILKTVKLTETSPLNIRIKQEFSAGPLNVQGDASLLKQLFLNLIKNAQEACGSDGELVIQTEPLPPWLRIRFSDNGPGIPSDHLERIFEPFFTTKSSGMGMGLAICQRIIQAHGGRLEAKNRLPQGAEFTIWLPT